MNTKTDLKNTCRQIVKSNMEKYSIALDETPRSIHHTIQGELLLDVDGLMLLYESLGLKECLARYKKRLVRSKKDIETVCYSAASIFSTEEDRRKANNRLFYNMCWLEYYQIVLTGLNKELVQITMKHS